MTTPVTRTYLELSSAEQLRRAEFPYDTATFAEIHECRPERYREMYREVGQPWGWTDRASWDDERILDHLGSEAVRLWELTVDGAPAGYTELRRHGDGSVEIAYFGLRPGFVGRGLGRAMLSAAVEEAYKLGADRVWLHTCTLDSPAALPNYLARGFRAVREERYEAPGG